MSQAALTSRARQIVASTLNVPAETIRADSDFVHDLGADSISMVEVAMALEDAFDVEAQDDELEHLKTFGAVVEWLKRATALAVAA